MKRILVPAALVFASAAVAVLLFEIVLRVAGFSEPVLYRPDPTVGYGLRPGIKGWGRREGHAFVQINSAGLRDREHSLEKPEGIYRIAVLGDSFSEALQVDIKNTFWSLLEDGLARCSLRPAKRIEVINFGVGGFGTAQEYLMLKSVAMHYQPDLVLLQFTNANDVTNNSIVLEEEKMRPFFRLSRKGELVLDTSFVASGAFQDRSSALKGLARNLADYSRVLQLVRAALMTATAAPVTSLDAAIEAGLNPGALVPPPDSSWEDAWAVTERLMLAMNDYLGKRGVRLVVVMTPYAIQVHPNREVREALQAKLGVPDLFYPDRRIEAYARKQGIAVIPLVYEMQRLAESSGIHFHGFPNTRMGMGHWNENGHRAAAEIIGRHLCSHRY